jgi:hypothetical protein
MEQIRTRLTALKEEFELGERQLRELMHQEAGIRETLLRISGAIQVLEELLADDSDAESRGHAASEPAVLQVP